MARTRAGQPRRLLPPTPLLDRFGRDLSAQARAGAFANRAERGDLVLRIARALLRQEKANPLLLREAGVGKTALVEALARRLADADAAMDPRLAGLRVVELSPAALVAGTGVHGALEGRMQALLAELRARPDVVLFLDEIHLLAGDGAADGIADALKPALARGEVRCIGATTSRDFDRSIRRDPALARRFLPIRVEEPTPDETLALLETLAPDLAAHHRVRIDPAALRAAVALSDRCQRDGRFPGKAIALLDDACARAALPSLDGPCPDAAPDAHGGGVPEVRPETVAEAVAERTGIPLAHLTGAAGVGSGSADPFACLGAAVVGQDGAVAAVADAVRLVRAGLRPDERPRGLFLFGGPSGVGKTALARALARCLSGDERALLRIDLSEFGEPHSASRLIGAPPGYLGHDAGGQLTRALLARPASVVLLDEVEKAHPRVLGLLLQLFDAGRLSDGAGVVADGRHARMALGVAALPLNSAVVIGAEVEVEPAW